jgi:hypothetical protein
MSSWGSRKRTIGTEDKKVAGDRKGVLRLHVWKAAILTRCQGPCGARSDRLGRAIFLVR